METTKQNIVISIDVFQDFACPWCYVGKHRFHKAISQFIQTDEGKSVKIQINWHPYMIDTKTKKEGEEYLAYNKRRWGGDSWTKDLRHAGKQEGLEFKNWCWWPNTLNVKKKKILFNSLF